MSFRITASAMQSSTTLTLDGELDIAETSALRKAVDGALAQGTRSIVLEMSGVTFIDCAGLAALVACRRVVRSEGGELQLGGVSPAVQRVLKLTRTGDSFVAV